MNYHEARAKAQTDANQFQRPMAIEKFYDGYHIKMLPIKSSDRYGWELRCEVVDPDERSEA